MKKHRLNVIKYMVTRLASMAATTRSFAPLLVGLPLQNLRSHMVSSGHVHVACRLPCTLPHECWPWVRMGVGVLGSWDLLPSSGLGPVALGLPAESEVKSGGGVSNASERVVSSCI